MDNTIKSHEQVEFSSAKDDGGTSNALLIDSRAAGTTDSKAGGQSAQGTVDKLFPKPMLEEGTVISRIKTTGDMYPAVPYAPDNFFEFTDQFKRLAPAERFNNSGWTDDLQKDLVKNTLAGIAASGAKGQFGLEHNQWQDARTAIEIAGVAGKLPEFVKALNDGLQQKPFDGSLHLEVGHYPAQKPWLGHESGESIGIKLIGGNGDWRKQTEVFSYPFSYSHTPEFVKLNPKEKLGKEGWTPELAKELANLVSNQIDSISDHQGSFGKNKTEFRDSAQALAIARSAGADKLQQVVDLINQTEKARGRAPVELEKTPQSNLWFIGHEAYSTLKVQGAPEKNWIKLYDKYYDK